MESLPLRLQPGCDLRHALEEAVRHRGAPAFVVSGIGSLVTAQLRFADRNDTTVIAGPLEILSLAGSISPDGAHLHMAVSTSSGQVIGGHVAYGNIVRTTAEILLALLPEWKLSREDDPATGYKELVVR